ncbi:hypothetical protein ACFVXC_29690 [Streptomyces sp. NPDC058257]|uniref:hypothetical protein n=1 Tax=Streptomyces sp. NPDC058257 TaxID=3346409 RepID=UPI0036F079BD
MLGVQDLPQSGRLTAVVVPEISDDGAVAAVHAVLNPDILVFAAAPLRTGRAAPAVR